MALTYLGFTLLFLFGFGEKIRWGQFILELNIPELFAKNNTQGQITIHNLKFGDFSVNKVIFGKILGICVVIYTLIIPYMYFRGVGFIKKIVEKTGLPIPKLSQVIWYIVIVSIALSIPVPKKGEVVQFAGVLSFLMFFSFPKNRDQITN